MSVRSRDSTLRALNRAYEAEAHFGLLLVREAAALYRLGPALLCQIDVDGRYAAGRGGSAAGAAPRAREPHPPRLL
jgi:hypothetical protein